MGRKPTTQLLRHRDKSIEAVTKRRYHSFLGAKINEPFPDKDQEADNPEAADEVYQSGVRWLLNHTRPDDGKNFDLIFKENVAYGFRRNALGMKPFGLIVSIGSLLWVLATEGALFSTGHEGIDLAALSRMPEPATASLIISVVMVFAWLLFFTKASARTAAFTYARHFYERATCFESLSGKGGSGLTLKEVARRLRERQIQDQRDKGTPESLVEKLKTLLTRMDDEKTVSDWFTCEVCGQVMLDGKSLWTLIGSARNFEEFLRLAENATQRHEGTHRS